MRNIIATISVLFSICANAQYKETLHAHITPTNKVVTCVPDWVKSDTPPQSGLSSNEVVSVVDYKVDGNYVPFSLDKKGRLTSVTIGESITPSSVGDNSLAVGENHEGMGTRSIIVGNRNESTGTDSALFGTDLFTGGNNSLAVGKYSSSSSALGIALGAYAKSINSYAFVWAGATNLGGADDARYESKGVGTFNIYPRGGLNGFYIGGTNLATILSSNSGPEIDLDGFATVEDLLAFYYPDGSVKSMDQITTNGIQYAVGSDGGAYVVGGDGLSGDVVLPWKVNIGGKYYKVTDIGESAFDADYYSNSFKSFIAPITVKRIGVYAFYYLDSLRSVSIPCVTNVGGNSFSYCGSLTSISFPSAESIGDGAFLNCGSLTSVSLPSAKSIGNGAFSNCFDLPSISLPSAKSIEIGAFSFCMNLSSVSLPSAINIGQRSFSDCTSIKSLSLPSATSIFEEAFINCNSLEYISLHSTEYIYIEDAFKYCESLSIVDFGSSTKSDIPTLHEYAFEEVPTTCKFIIPIGMYDDWISWPEWNSLYAQGYKFEGYASIDDVRSQTPTLLSNGSETRTAASLFRSMDNQDVLWRYVYGESVWIAVTNYMRTVAGVAPSFQLWEVRDGNTNCVYWSAEEIDIRVGDKIDVAVTNAVKDKADKAWAKYQSMTGADNPQPNDITIVSTPSVMLSGGYEWQRFVDTGNEVWILKCNCPTMLGSSSVSNGVNTGNGYFKITDAEGKTHFSVEKTDSKLVDAVPDSVSFSNDGNGYFQVSFQSNVKPSLYVSADLNTPFIECNEDSENDYGLTCSWSEANGIYTATIIYNPAEGKPSKLFAYGKVMQEGSVVIKNTAATSFDGGIIIGGNRYTIGTAVINGKTVLTLENGQAVNE